MMRFTEKVIAAGCAIMMIVGSAIAAGTDDYLAERFTDRMDKGPVEIGYASIAVETSTGEEVVRHVVYENVDGLAVFENDMVLGTVDEFRQESHGGDAVANGAVITGQQFRWPDGVVPYVIDNDLPEETKAEIAAAMDHWELQPVSDLRFGPR